ncbi:PAS domain S-box protein [Methanobacterium alkalithermotolerans]|uniref:PAS domain S-box protein n=1 Tax=Methanobacterium alkalithermotolerans TaxID=2731220 RepID=A0A8T8K520_9EURY|nr:PAS domain S-box protein [Methanobacterium alkalithermotolerans]QUH22585.1 PAS domain S-box protein [Methanobacterium alkalithermotolerans]
MSSLNHVYKEEYKNDLKSQFEIIKSIMDNINTPVFSLDTHYHYTSFNKAHQLMMKSIYGVDIELGKSILKYQSVNEDRLKAKINLDRALNGEKVTVTAYSGKEELSRLFFEVEHQPLYDKKGKIKGVSVFARDITSQKQAENAILKERNKLKSLLDSLPDGICILSDDYQVLYTNPALEREFGEVNGKKCHEYIFGKREACSWCRNTEIFAGEFQEHRLKSPVNGKTYELFEAPIKTFPKIKSKLLKLHDITPEIKTQKKQQQSQDKYRLLIENLQEGIWEIDKNADTIFVNDKMATMLGYSPEEMMGKNLFDFMDESVIPFAEKNLKKRKKGLKERHDFEFMKKDGEKIYTTLITTPLQDVDGNYQGAIAAVIDISDLKDAQNALEASEGFLRGLFENMPSGMAVYEVKNQGKKGQDYLIKEFNKTSQRMEGKSREEVIGKSLYDLRPNIDEYGLIGVFKKVWGSGEAVYFPEKIYVDENYSNWYENYVFKAPTGEVVAIYNDVTEKKRAELEIKKSLKEKEILLSEIHHRVKNNLQIIVSLLHLQEIHEEDLRLIRILRETQGRVRTMALVHNTLYQSNIITNINFQNYAQQLLEGILSSFDKSRCIKTNFEIDDIPINLETAIPLGLIINELVTNSIKYAFFKDEGTISIKLEPLDNQFQLSVGDDGVGIKKDIDITNTRTLGLQLVNSLVNQLDGEIELDRSRGTCFKIKFKILDYKKRI